MTFLKKLALNLFSADSEPSEIMDKELAQERRMNKLLLRALSDTSKAIMIIELDASISYANPAMCSLLDSLKYGLNSQSASFSSGDIIGQRFTNLGLTSASVMPQLGTLTKEKSVSIQVGQKSILLSFKPLLDEQKAITAVLLEWEEQTQQLHTTAMMNALDRSQAVIEFSPAGIITAANENFLNTSGYTAAEIIGQHHEIFMPPEMRNTPDYKAFWKKLNDGQFLSAEYKRLGKGGREIWLSATYNPVKDVNGNVTSIVKYATDITQQKIHSNDFASQISAIDKSQAVIEFSMDGTISRANDMFLNAFGYTLNEIVGKHHSIFAENGYADTAEYKQFWADLNAGKHATGEFARKAKDGSDVWLQASYNPIIGIDGKPYKVVKYASDISERKLAISEIKRVLTSLSDGDLTARIQGNFGSEFAELNLAINNFSSHINQVIARINQAASTISVSARQIAKGNSDLSTRTEQQASSLEETSSTMEELTSTVRLNSENTNTADQLANEASGVALNGGEVIAEVVTTMSAINDSAEKISDIIGVIDGIAFQTNILALNAAVEAARAGEQGRGFAVVASEVRALAQRSANAAKDIKTLISDSVVKIENGNELVNQSGETMDKVVTSIKNVTHIMKEINEATREQSSGIEEVSKAILQMDDVTQQNAALVEEAAAASENMQSEAEKLAAMVDSFKLSH